MKNTTNPEPNYRDYYSPFSMILPLDSKISIPKDDMVFTFVEVMKGVDSQYT